MLNLTRQLVKVLLSRWLKTIMSKAGIDITKFSSHSVRAASVSKAKLYMSVENIVKSVGWSNANTFAKFYDKPIQTVDFQTAVLK